jgi:hypothetical protein
MFRDTPMLDEGFIRNTNGHRSERSRIGRPLEPGGRPSPAPQALPVEVNREVACVREEYHDDFGSGFAFLYAHWIGDDTDQPAGGRCHITERGCRS